MTQRIVLTLLALTFFASRATAHDFTTSYSHVRVEGRTVSVRLALNLKDLHVADIASAVENNYRIEGPDAPSSRIVQASRGDCGGRRSLRSPIRFRPSTHDRANHLNARPNYTGRPQPHS